MASDSASTAPRFGRYAPATHTLVHVSDPHLLAGGAALGGRFDVDRTLERTLAAIESAAGGPTPSSSRATSPTSGSRTPTGGCARRSSRWRSGSARP